ncbi:MAG: hypothetical protein WD042_15580 [Phycisphaeraceae bacterium]
MADFLPRRDANLANWAKCFAAHIAADPQRYGLSAAQAQAFAGVQQAYAQAHQVANSPSTRTLSSIMRKNGARRAMKDMARRLARLVHATPGVSDTMKAGLGLALHVDGGRAAVNARVPGLRLTAEAKPSRRVKVRLRDRDSLRKGKPRGVVGAMIFRFVGERPTTRPEDWVFVGNTTRANCTVPIPPGLPPGTKVWFTAAWLDGRLREGPWSMPVMMRVLFGWTALPGNAPPRAMAA